MIRDTVLRVLGATMLLALTALPLRAHQVDPPTASSASQATSAVTATGIVAELIVDNRVSGTTSRYLALRLDDGQTVALSGVRLDSLGAGARVAATGTLTGNMLAVTSFNILPATQVAARASILAQGQQVVQGTLVVFHKDYFTEGRGEYGLGVHDGASQMTPLNVAVIPDAVRPGMTVSVSGTTAADNASLDAGQITILGLPSQPAGGVAAAPTTNNVLVLPIKFTDSPASDPFTPTQVDQVMRTNPDSVAAYYSEVSYGLQQLDITVACATAPVLAGCANHTSPGGWLLASSAAPPNCDFTAIANLADAAATAAGYNLGSYQNRFYVLPGLSCGWAGLAYIGFPYQAWSNAYNALWVYGHELGHNFTLYHAGSISCGTQVLGGSCSASEYGDRFDVMGNNSVQGQQMHFNARQKSHLNWIPASSVATHTSGTATYSLSPLESPGQASYAVKIPVATNANRTYWIEYRQPIGFDSALAIYPNNGALIRVASPFEVSSGSDDTEILDMTPGSFNGFYDAALLVGQTYSDSTYGISVTVNSATASALNLTVSMVGGFPSTTTLATSGTPSLVGANVTFTATVNGSAPTGSVAFTADGAPPLGGCSAVALPAGSTNTKTATCTTGSLSVATHSIVATYTGDATNGGSFSATLSQLVNPVGSINVALAGNGGVASASSTYSAGYAPNGAIDNVRSAANWGNGGGWNDGTASSFPDWLQVNFSASQRINRVVVYSLQDNYQNPVEPTDTMTFSLYGLVDFTVQGWDGSSWVTLGTVSGNNLVKRTVSFPTYTTDRIRINITNALNAWSRVTEVEAWTANGTPSMTTITTSGSPSNLGTNVTFTATVTGSAPTGSVAFTADATTLSGCGTVALPTGSANAKTASCITPSLAAGTHGVVANYAGDAANNGSTSATLSQVVSGSGQTNVALASNGGVASASSTYSGAYSVSVINDNQRAGVSWGNGGGWNDGTVNSFPDWVQINFNGIKTIDHVVIYTVQDNYNNPIEPTDTLTFSLYGITDFTVQGWDGASWVTLGTVSGNNLVKRTVNFSAYITDRIRINITNALGGYSRITEVEAWGASGASTNVALASNDGVASASSTYSAAYPVSAINDNQRAGVNWGNGGGWNDGTVNSFPDWVQINFNGIKTIDHVVIYTAQDNYSNPIEPTDTLTFGLYGITDFTVQGWDGAGWVTLGTVSGNNLVKRTVNFSAYITDRIRINITNALGGYSRITEFEAWGN